MVGPLLTSLAFLVAGILYITLGSSHKLGSSEFQARTGEAAGEAAEMPVPVCLSPRQDALPGSPPCLLLTLLPTCPSAPSAPADVAHLLLHRRPACHLVDWAGEHEPHGARAARPFVGLALQPQPLRALPAWFCAERRAAHGIDRGAGVHSCCLRICVQVWGVEKTMFTWWVPGLQGRTRGPGV